MSTVSPVYLCIGQCGIQLGQNFIERSLNSLGEDNNPVPVILVDSDSKVTRRARERLGVCDRSGRSSRGVLDERNVISTRGGCGNNWGLGYLMGREPFKTEGAFSSYCTLGERVMESVRRSVERLDSQRVTVLFHSIAGGTGAGLGSHLLELLREDYPKTHLHSIAVLPHSSGDTPLQSYNSLLSLTTIQECIDSCLLLSNDGDMGCGNKVLTYTIEDINTRFTRNILGLYTPAVSLSDNKHIILNLQNLLTYLCPDNTHKFFSINQVTSTTAKPSYLLKQVVTQKLKAAISVKNPTHNIYRAVLVARGMEYRDSIHGYTEVKDKLTHLFYSPISNSRVELLHGKDAFPCNGNASVTLGLNSSLDNQFFQQILTSSVSLLSQRAYLHWYHEYGVSEDKFKQSIEHLSELIVHY